MAKLLDKLNLKRFLVMGTSYGGFVAYHLAKMLGERVDKVVIASSGVNMRKSDNVTLLARAKLHNIEDLMLPANPHQLRNLMALSVSRRLHMLPDFFLNDFLNVRLFPLSLKINWTLLALISNSHTELEQIFIHLLNFFLKKIIELYINFK